MLRRSIVLTCNILGARSECVKKTTSLLVTGRVRVLPTNDKRTRVRYGRRRPRMEALESRWVLDSTAVFNELMYHPADSTPEWVELHNQLAADLDLSNWQLSGAVDYTFPAGTILPGRGYLVVSADPAMLQAATGFDQSLGPFAGKLSNSGESLRLLSNNQRVMDRLDYRDGPSFDHGNWPVEADGSGATLAKRFQDSGSALPENWTFSEQIGGTPGAVNFAHDRVLEEGNLLGFFPFDNDLFDESRSGNHGALFGSVPFIPGYEGQAVSFTDNVSNFIRLPIDTSTQNRPAVTWGAWVKSSDPSGNINTILSNDDGGWDRFLFHDSNQWAVSHGGGIQHSGVPTSTDWTFLAATFNGSTQQLYVDSDTPVLTTNDSAGPTLTYTEVGRNANACGVCPWSGTIDNVFIFDEVLSSAQIAQIRAGGATAILDLENPAEDPSGGAIDLPDLAFHEISGAGQQPFQVELINAGDEPVELAGMIVAGTDSGTPDAVLADRTLAPGEFLVLDHHDLGFTPLAGSRLFLYLPDQSSVIAGAEVTDQWRARYPDATGRWLVPSVATFGSPNQFAFETDIVISEIMYHDYPARNVDGQPFVEPTRQWIELTNRGDTAVDLSGWQFDGGLDFHFADGTLLDVGEYLVVTNDLVAMTAEYPSIDIVGNFTGTLSRSNDRIVLRDAVGNPADELHYYDGGRWPEQADSGGSSLELVDLHAANAAAESGLPSVEYDDSLWQTVTYRGVAVEDGIGPDIWHEFVLGLLDAGELLLDDIQVVESPDGAARQLIQNGDFEADAVGAPPNTWRLIGTHGSHGRSQVIVDPDAPLNQVLHLVATGPTEDKHNQASTTLAGGATITAGTEYEISFRARWLSGSNQVNTRLYFNWLQRTTHLDVPQRHGTPGAANSQAIHNQGPTYQALQHAPVIPASGEAVTVSVRAADPDGVSQVTLNYAVNGGVWQSVGMVSQPSGDFEALIPGQPAGNVVQFYVQGVDTAGATSTFPAAGIDSRALFEVNDNAGGSGELHSLRIIMTPADEIWLYDNTNRMSNDRLGATVIQDENVVYYDVGVRLKGSAFGRTHDAHAGFNIEFSPDDLFRDVHETIAIERGPSKKEILGKHLFNASGGGLASLFDDPIHVIAPRSQDNGVALLSMARYTNDYFQSQYVNGDEGTLYNMELLYTPTTTITPSDPEGPKLNHPYTHTRGNFELQDLGDDKEAYRWIRQIRNNREKDDYSLMIALSQALELTGAALDEAIQQVMDVDQWMRTFALESLLGNDDFYTRTWNHNFRMYQRPEDNRMLALPWDLDRSFQLAVNAPLWGGTKLANVIELPGNLHAYYGHLHHLIQNTYNFSYMSDWTNHYGSLIGQSFLAELNYIAARGAYVSDQLPQVVAFDITTNGGQPFTVDTLQVTLDGDAWIDVRDIRLKGSSQPLDITWTTATRWQVTVPINPGQNSITLEAVDFDGNVAASDTIDVTSTSPDGGIRDHLRITELHYNPASPAASELQMDPGLNNDDFEFVELRNVGSAALDLTGVRFADGVTFNFSGSAITSLAPGQYVLVVTNAAAFELRYGTGHPIAGEYAGRFSNGGEHVLVLDATNGIIADFTYDNGGFWPELADGLDSSLVVIDTSGDYNDPFNWFASGEAHGTPGTMGNQTAVMARQVFYNNSTYDNYGTGIDASDDLAIAADKEPLFPTRTADFENYTSYVHGLNGIMIDVLNLPHPELADFEFVVGSSSDLLSWPRAADPDDWNVRPGSGVGGSDRITFIWDDGAIAGQWLRVTVAASATTGLSRPDTFYFGNAVGDSGNLPTNAFTDGFDFAETRDHVATQVNVEHPTDFNRDGRVDGADLSIVRDNTTNFVTALPLLAPPRLPAAPPAAEILRQSPEMIHAFAALPAPLSAGAALNGEEIEQRSVNPFETANVFAAAWQNPAVRSIKYTMRYSDKVTGHRKGVSGEGLSSDIGVIDSTSGPGVRASTARFA